MKPRLSRSLATDLRPPTRSQPNIPLRKRSRQSSRPLKPISIRKWGRAQQWPKPERFPKSSGYKGEKMAVTIEIPTAFRRFTDGAPRFDCSAATIAEALNILTTQFPGLSRHVRDDQGQIRQFLNVYLNEEDIRFLGGEECAVKEGDKVLLVPSIAGGC